MVSSRMTRLLCFGMILFMISGCGIFKHEPTITPLIPSVIAVPVQPEDLVFVDCPFEIPDDMPPEVKLDIRCANLTVPEDWLQLDGPKIQLAVAIVKTASPEPKSDPLLVFLGNPGYGLSIAP